MALVLAGIAAAFVIFEYTSDMPCLIEFRFAAPYNRIRFLTLFMLVFLLLILQRAPIETTQITGFAVELAQACSNWLSLLFSPSLFGITGPGTEASYQETLLRYSVSLGLVMSFVCLCSFSIVLWVFSWPIRRKNFNLWVNMPTFDPSEGGYLQRRLTWEAVLCIFAGIALPLSTPLLISVVTGWFDLEYSQTFVWTVALWAFLPAMLVMRGIAFLKIAYLVRKTRSQ